MQYRILGPLEIISSTQQVVPIRGRMPRTILATLLLTPNQWIGYNQLVERLWEGSPPPSAQANLRNYLSRIRQALRRCEPSQDPVQVRCGGYRLRVEPGELDAERFDRLATDGCQALHRREYTTAARHLAEALRTWRGPVLAGLDLSEPLRGEAARLELRRLAVAQDGIDARLALGLCGEVIPELHALISRHQLRERLWTQLMRALYRDGRQADALAAYQQIRQVLADELGIDPGPDLQRLHHRILTADPTLTAPVANHTTIAADDMPAAAVPAQLPPDLGTFVGRSAELDRLAAPRHSEYPTRAVVISAIDGMAGVGKTTLATHAAHRLADQFPDGQLFLDLHGYTQGVEPIDAAAALDRLLRAVGVAAEQIPDSLDERSALYRTQLADKRILIVLDNASDESQVQPLLPGSPGCLVLVTSRRRLPGLDGTSLISLDVHDLPEAVALFTRTAGPGRIPPGSDALVAEIVELCGRLPLAVRIAASRFRHRPCWTLGDVVDLLRDQRGRLAELQAGNLSVAAAFHLSYQQLPADLRRTFRLLGLHPGPDIDAHAVAALTGTTAHEARTSLDRLIDSHLLVQHTPGRYRFHDLIRAHAMRTCQEDEPGPERDTAQERLLDHYRHTAAAAMDIVYPHETGTRPRMAAGDTLTTTFDSTSDAEAWLDVELPNLLAAAFHAARHGNHHNILTLAATLDRHLRTRRWPDAVSLHSAALDAARTTNDPVGELHALNCLGWIHRMQGRHEQGVKYLEQALDVSHQTGHTAGETAALISLGWIHRTQGRHGQATSMYLRALHLARATADRGGEMTALGSLGHLHHVRGELSQGRTTFRHALDIARAIGDRNGELNALIGLGHIDRAQFRYDTASASYQQALDIARATGDRGGELNALNGLGHIYLLHARYDDAATCFTRMLHIARPIRDRNFDFEALLGLGLLHHATGRLQEADDHLHQALHIANTLAQPTDQVRAHDGIAHLHRTLGQEDHARAHWQSALAILTASGSGHTPDENVSTTSIRRRLASGVIATALSH